MVNKLDAILKNVFDHFSRAHPRPSPLMTPSELLSPTESPALSPAITRPASPENTDQTRAARRTQFYTPLSIFERTILKTFKSRYTQFLVFWYSSLDVEFADIFQGMLVSKALLEEDQPMVTRTAAASYIASFVSRAQFVDRDSTRRVMGCLCSFLGNCLDVLNAVVQPGADTRSATQHGVFYAVSQAVFLIFCFRWRDLQQDEEELEELAAAGAPPSKWMTELEILRRVVQSELNPLKVGACIALLRITSSCSSFSRSALRMSSCNLRESRTPPTSSTAIRSSRRTGGPTSRPAPRNPTPPRGIHL